MEENERSIDGDLEKHFFIHWKSGDAETNGGNNSLNEGEIERERVRIKERERKKKKKMCIEERGRKICIREWGNVSELECIKQRQESISG